jgi:hypothetical protein
MASGFNGCLDAACSDCLHESSVITLVLVCVFDRKFTDRIVNYGADAQAARGAGLMRLGE